MLASQSFISSPKLNLSKNSGKPGEFKIDHNEKSNSSSSLSSGSSSYEAKIKEVPEDSFETDPEEIEEKSVS